MKRSAPFYLLAAVAIGLHGCSAAPPSGLGVNSMASTGSTVPATSNFSHADAARLERGDKLKVVVFNEPQLSGEFLVDTGGTMAFPLIGEVAVAGLTAREVEQRLVERLSGRYLVNPRISVEIANQRPIYVLGEVGKAGEYPYRPGLNVVSAIALAGGFSPRAATATVVIRRANDLQARQYPVQPGVPILPGDMITVQERLF